MLAGARFSTLVIDLIGFFAVAAFAELRRSTPFLLISPAAFATSFTCSKTDGNPHFMQARERLACLRRTDPATESGTVVHSKSQTFSRKVLANGRWRRCECKMEQEPASGQAQHKRVSVGELLRDYVSATENMTEWGRSKKADIARLRPQGHQVRGGGPEGLRQKRRAEDGDSPATVLNGMAWQRHVSVLQAQ
jgi:hypothetical protein